VTVRSVALFIAAALAEIGGAYLVWVGIKDHRGIAFVALGASRDHHPVGRFTRTYA